MSGLLTVSRNELRRILGLKPVFSVMVGALAIYALLYPQPYRAEALRRTPVAVVDQDQTVTSRDLVRRLDASPDAAVASVRPDFPAARRSVFAREVSGILVVPEGFERELLRGNPSPVALYADASYFLVYQRLALGVSTIAHTVGAEVEVRRLIGLGVDAPVATAAANPMPLTTIPLFNPQEGYASYVLPAAFVLILQQTLLIGVGLLGTLPGADAVRRTAEGTIVAGPFATVAGKLLAYLALEVVLVPLYLVVLPFFYGIPRLGGLLPTLLFAAPFVLATGALGLIIAAAFRTPLAVQLVMAALGLPFFFLSGFSWPFEAMPQVARWLALPVPSTSAIEGFVALGQLGAGLSDVRANIVTLLTLASSYTALAVWLESRSTRASSKAPGDGGMLPR
uniref:ABC transporter permease n=1 Tax=Bosea sp. NBC_00436 TaxID=2969620 RepID=A0A9E8CUA6_9HYPH